MYFLEKIDSLLNSITMYRLVLYGLTFLSAIAILFGFLGILPYTGVQFLQTLAVILIFCFISNQLFAKLVRADTNVESLWITSFILFLVLAPVAGQTDLIVTVLISVTAMASKYFLTYEKKHIFNPAAIAMFLAGLFGFGNSIWWVGSSVLLPLVTVIGFLIVRKIRRFRLFFAFAISAVISVSIFNLFNGMGIMETITQVIFSWPLIFFGTIMLTEPFTTPPNKRFRMIYGIFVGILFGSQFTLGPLYASPEFALVAGNILSFFLSPKGKLILKFKERNRLAPTIFEFIFTHNRRFDYLPGQYLEWTLPHKDPDARGIRRYFTIASAPGEDFRLGVKIIPDKSSSFKRALLNLKPGNNLTADQLSGDFVLPAELNQKLVFVAGGIGVTPFRSMVKNLLDSGRRCDITLFYSSSNPEEFVYKNLFEKAKDLGVKTIYLLGGEGRAPKNWPGETGYLTPALIKRYVPDFKERKFYLSGPIAMVNNYKSLLGSLGIGNVNIVTDYFPGF